MPFFRTHSAFFLPRREPWEFGEEILDVARATLKLRYRLLPYWYTLAWWAHETGAPLVRPLFWADPADAGLWRIDDSFMAGDALLVAPVLAEGARRRDVRLPRGTWFDFRTGGPIAGGGVVDCDAPLAVIPLLVRDGSVIPDVSGRMLTLHLYPPDIGTSRTSFLYSDAGDGYGAHRIDSFRFAGTAAGSELTWTHEGDFPWPYDSVLLRLYGPNTIRVTIDGSDVRPENGSVALSAFARLFLPR